MLIKLLVLFIALPLAEIVLLIEIGSRIGTLATLAILVLTAVLGASLAHREGLKVLWRIQEKMAQGIMPDEELIDGVLILAAGIVFIDAGLADRRGRPAATRARQPSGAEALAAGPVQPTHPGAVP